MKDILMIGLTMGLVITNGHSLSGIGAYSIKATAPNSSYMYKLNEIDKTLRLVPNGVPLTKIPSDYEYGISWDNEVSTDLRVVRTFSPPCHNVSMDIGARNTGVKLQRVLPNKIIEDIPNNGTMKIRHIDFTTMVGYGDNKDMSLGEIGCYDIYPKITEVTEVYRKDKNNKWELFRRGIFVFERDKK